jgi:transposase
MFLRPCYRVKDGKRHAYWALVKSERTAKGSRQKVVSYLGDLDEADRLAVHATACGKQSSLSSAQLDMYETHEPKFAEVDTNSIAAENVRSFGGAWLVLEIIRKIGFKAKLDELLPAGREDVPWSIMSLILVISRLLDPSSELRIAEHLFEQSALSDLLGVSAAKINDDRLYRALDALLPHKVQLEKYFKNKLGEIFNLSYDLLLYDVTSTYFEGQCKHNEDAQRGYSRDNRGDCKQVCIALVVSRCGMPLGYELFAGNKADVSTVQEIVTTMEERYGKSDRIWVMDRGMVSAQNVEFLRAGNRRYIIGTHKTLLQKYQKQILAPDWKTIRDGLEVKIVPAPDCNGDVIDDAVTGEATDVKDKANSRETFILCRSSARGEKEKSMHDKFEKRIEDGLLSLQKMAERQTMTAVALSMRVGKLLGKNTRAAGAFKTEVATDDKQRASLTWEKVESWKTWARLSEGCYILRSNVSDWTPEELWRAYTQLTECENAFRIQKSDLRLRPIWHQKKERVRAHILVCFIAFVLWKTLGRMCHAAGLGDEPRRVLENLSTIQTVDVVMKTKAGQTIRKRCIGKPTDHQQILLHKLGLCLPRHLAMMEM